MVKLYHQHLMNQQVGMYKFQKWLWKRQRLVEHGRDVVILLDPITRLGRAFNTVVPSSGKVLTGGVDANALQRA